MNYWKRNDVVGDYKIIKRLSEEEGNQANVYTVRRAEKNGRQSNKVFVLKATKRGRYGESEIKLWQDVSQRKHPNILGLIEWFIYDGLLCLISEYIEEGTLRKFLVDNAGKSPDQETTFKIFEGILSGVSYVHTLGQVHRDLKPENIALSYNIPLLMDFGLSRIAKSTIGTTGVGGTLRYAPPEIARELFKSQFKANTDVSIAFPKSETPISKRGDVWSLGIILYEMIFGDIPFDNLDVLENPDAPIVGLETLSKPVSDFIGICLSKNPDLRFADAGEAKNAFDEAMRYVRHEEIQKIEIEKKLAQDRADAFERTLRNYQEKQDFESNKSKNIVESMKFKYKYFIEYKKFKKLIDIFSRSFLQLYVNNLKETNFKTPDLKSEGVPVFVTSENVSEQVRQIMRDSQNLFELSDRGYRLIMRLLEDLSIRSANTIHGDRTWYIHIMKRVNDFDSELNKLTKEKENLQEDRNRFRQEATLRNNDKKQPETNSQSDKINIIITDWKGDVIPDNLLTVRGLDIVKNRSKKLKNQSVWLGILVALIVSGEAVTLAYFFGADQLSNRITLFQVDAWSQDNITKSLTAVLAALGVTGLLAISSHITISSSIEISSFFKKPKSITLPKILAQSLTGDYIGRGVVFLIQSIRFRIGSFISQLIFLTKNIIRFVIGVSTLITISLLCAAVRKEVPADDWYDMIKKMFTDPNTAAGTLITGGIVGLAVLSGIIAVKLHDVNKLKKDSEDHYHKIEEFLLPNIFGKQQVAIFEKQNKEINRLEKNIDLIYKSKECQLKKSRIILEDLTNKMVSRILKEHTDRVKMTAKLLTDDKFAGGNSTLDVILSHGNIRSNNNVYKINKENGNEMKNEVLVQDGVNKTQGIGK